MPGDVLSLRALSRATLDRQLLLRRSGQAVEDAVHHLVGMQAQLPQNPYLALWSRLEAFEPGQLSRLLEDRRLVRIVLLRGTLHLVTADDCLVLRPLAQPILDRELVTHRDHRDHLRGVDLAPVLSFARALLEKPRTGPELKAALEERFPHYDAAALAFACRNHLALVQVPPRGLWRRSAQIRTATAESWLSRPLATDPPLDDVVLRYLAAYGPSTVADVATWSRLTGLREVLERLRPRLRTFRDPAGRELFDVPDAPRPGPDVSAPPRFLPEYDNVLLSHADRSRFVPEDHRQRLYANPRTVRGSVLHDGALVGTWSLDGADLVVHHAAPLPKRAATAVAVEAHRAWPFLSPGNPEGDVRFVAL